MSEKLLPIVPGCLCLWISRGIVVKVVEKVLNPNNICFRNKDGDLIAVSYSQSATWWRSDKEYLFRDNFKDDLISEKYLVRIDGHNETEQEKARELTT